MKRNCPNTFQQVNQMNHRGRGRHSNYRGRYVNYMTYRPQMPPVNYYPRGVFGYRPRYNQQGPQQAGYAARGQRGYRPQRYPTFANVNVGYEDPNYGSQFGYEGYPESFDPAYSVHDPTGAAVNVAESYDSYVDSEGATWVRVEDVTQPPPPNN